ncbi:MAG TPA: efflux RND transporter periplasmic adaptor subunit [Steroidobacteraceae bacterium]
MAPALTLRLRTVALTVAAVAALAACGHHQPPATAAVVKTSGLATVEVGAEAAPSETLLDGVVEAVHQAALSAQTAGRVDEVYVEVDDKVTRGQLLVRLRAAEQVAGLGEAEAALAAATARDAQARAQHDRIRDMYERKVVARSTYDEALAARDGATAGLAAARAGLAAAREGVGYTEVRAPYDGVVTDKRVHPGETVAPGSPLVTVAALPAMRVVAEVPQSLAPAVRANPKATVYAGDVRIEASKVTLYPSAQPQSGTFRAHIDLPADAAPLAPGTFAKVAIAGGESNRLLVPRTAVVQRSELRAVYVVGADGRVALRQVRLGRTIGDRTEVIAGLEQGEHVARDPSAAGLVARQPQVANGHE